MSDLTWIEDGGVTSPAGFVAGGVYTGIKSYGEEPRLDVGLLASETPATLAATLTRNAVQGWPVRWNRALLEAGAPVRALFANSGVSNTANGEQGRLDNERSAQLAATRLGCEPSEVLTGSTGVIGNFLPMDLVERGLAAVELSEDGGTAFARSIMTTDTVHKQAAVSFEAAGRRYTVGGCAKGSGMIHPDMATMFGFLTTDAPCDQDWLRATWRAVVDDSFNMVDIDMDTSTSDTALVLANGAAGGDAIDTAHAAAASMTAALAAVAQHLARELARDGEGAETLIEVTVEGATSVEDARIAARTVSSSPLIKTMVTGRDPNWGRLMMAVGRSGAQVDQDTISIWIAGVLVLDRGAPVGADLEEIARAMNRDEVALRVDLALGQASATAWGCDLTTEYVHINADYTT
jgi:glutamate N-acetyltransferase/amino-acid N-acetyltransferase